MARENPPARLLASPGDPLVLLDGMVIQDPKARKARVATLVNAIRPEDYRPKQRRSIKDLPAAPRVMNGVAAIFVYTMMGLGDREIADVLGITSVDVEQVRRNPAYSECFNGIFHEFINENSDYIQSRIAAYKHMALETVADIAMNGQQESNKLKAGIDILDRGEKDPRGGKGGTNELRIAIIKKDQNVEVSIEGINVT